jgi:V/A-type H+-transporting ATPase subunit G/H
MQEIVTRVLEAEKAAEERLREARSRAGEIRAQADREVQEMLQEAREQASRRSQEILEKARGQARLEYEKSLQKAQDENRDFFRTQEEPINRAAEAVVALITVPQWS